MKYTHDAFDQSSLAVSRNSNKVFFKSGENILN